MESNLIKIEDYNIALEIVKKYRIQQKYKKTISQVVLDFKSEELNKIIDFVFIKKEKLNYNQVVFEINFYLKNKLNLKIGINNVKIIFKELLKKGLIKSKKENSNWNLYFK